jgi:hypothetical protein
MRHELVDELEQHLPTYGRLCEFANLFFYFLEGTSMEVAF